MMPPKKVLIFFFFFFLITSMAVEGPWARGGFLNNFLFGGITGIS
jgi:hypothetical protein